MNLSEKRVAKLERLARACNVTVNYPLTKRAKFIWIKNDEGEGAGFETPRRAESWLRDVKRWGWSQVF